MQNMQNLTLQLIALLSAFALGTGGASVVGLIVINGPNSTSCCAILQQQLPGKVSLPIQGLYEDEYSSSELEHKLACRNCQFAVTSREDLPSPTTPSTRNPRTASMTNSTTLPDDIEESILAKYRSHHGQHRRRVAVYDHIDAYNLTAALHGAVLSPGFQQKTVSTKKFRFLMAPMRM
ncbi:hypothetical protein Moror_9004 [Moniliophthora roreri MCA 2997]|uniref:Uncharacterized protein n=1 Tax=Moniliophthora roreri (strain MCA 2997) TaxID=1381753 RepID=V2XJA2_MONRO|nr:hypothetical protein Moror_9004 [Moniliophthora roreri MCA 2997]